MAFCFSSRWDEFNKTHRITITTLIIILLFLILTLVFLFQYVFQDRPQTRQPLLIHLNSFSVSNFSVTTSALEVEWKAHLTFENRDDEFEIFIMPFETYLYYNDVFGVSCASVTEPIHLKEKRQKEVMIKFKPGGCLGKLPPLEEKVFQQVWENREKNSIMHLDLQINLRFQEFQKGIAKWNLSINATCYDINVSFVSETEGKYMEGVRQCYIPW